MIITNDFPPRIGGIESFVREVCGLLDDDVVVYTSGSDDRERPYPVIRDGNLLLPTPRVRDRAVQLFADHGCRRVVFGAAAPLGLLAPALRRAGATRIVGLTHGHETWWATLPGSRRLLHRIGEGCDHLTTISAYTRRRIAPALSSAARDRLLQLAPPVDTGAFRPPDAQAYRDGPPRCIAVGRFVAQKGFSTLLLAWRRVVDRLADAELVLVGDGPRRAALQNSIATLGLRDCVRLTGPLPRERVIAELQQADVFALPVRTRLAGLNPEGLGLAALEAAACGLPVIVGRSGGAPETVRPGRTGFVVEPGDDQELAVRLAAVLGNRSQAQAMGAAGRAFVVEQFGLAAARATLRDALQLG